MVKSLLCVHENLSSDLPGSYRKLGRQHEPASHCVEGRKRPEEGHWPGRQAESESSRFSERETLPQKK